MILSKENIKTINIEQTIEENLSSGKLKELLFIVPTNRKLRDFKKEIIGAGAGKGISGFNLETFESLCGKILEVSRIFIQLEEAASAVLLNQAVGESELKYFSAYKEEIPGGTLNRIRSVITEYKRHGITPERLRAESENLPYAERLKALDIAQIYEKYSSKTSALSAYEPGDIYAGLLNLSPDKFKAGFREVFPDVKYIFINGFDEFSSPEADIIDLLSSVENSQLYIQFDYSVNNPEIFSHLDKCYKKLESKGFIRIKERKQKSNYAFRYIVKEKLFTETRGGANKEFIGSILKIPSYNREDEIISIAKEVKKLILKEGVEPYKICIAFNLVQNYSLIINEIFAVYGIPVNLTDRIYLEYTSPIIALLNLFEILENDYYYKNIIRAFSGNVISKEGIELKSIINSAVELKITGGKENWLEILQNTIDEKIRFTGENDFKAGEIKTYQTALKSITKIQDILKPFEEKLTIEEFFEKLELAVYNLDIPLNVLKFSPEKEKDIKALTTFIETLKEVFNLLILQYGGEKKFSISFFLDQIRTSAANARFNIKEKSDSAVLITSLEEIRGLEFEYLFIGGLCDGDFPTKYQPEIFFSGSFQKQEETHLKEERYRFYQSLCAWKKRLYLSFPVNESNKEMNESSFLKEFCRLFETTSFDKDYFKNKIFSKEEIQKMMGSVDPAVKKDILLPELINENFDSEYYRHASGIQRIRTQGGSGNSPYMGFIEKGNNDLPEELTEKIKEQFRVIENKQYSISQLETYAKCPFKFFIERVLNIKPEKEPSEEVEAIEMGNLLHAVFFEFFIFLREKKIKLNKCSEEQFIVAKKKLFEIAAREINNMPFSSPLSFYEKEKILGINGDETKSILFKLLKYEKESDDDFEAGYFETPFGNVDKDKSDSEAAGAGSINMNGVKLKGKIDRIEINEKEKLLRVVDYKLSGKKPTREELWSGISLQLPVYLAAAEQILFENYNEKLVPAEMVIYSLKYSEGDFGKMRIKMASKKEEDENALISELLEKAKEYIASYVSSISGGKFPLSSLPAREKLICGYCGLKPICRISEHGG